MSARKEKRKVEFKRNQSLTKSLNIGVLQDVRYILLTAIGRTRIVIVEDGWKNYTAINEEIGYRYDQLEKFLVNNKLDFEKINKAKQEFAKTLEENNIIINVEFTFATGSYDLAYLPDAVSEERHFQILKILE